MQPGLAVATTSGCDGGDVCDLPLSQLPRRLRLNQVVDPGAAAAQVLFGERQQLDARNLLQQIARLLADALGVGEVAGVVVGDAQVQRVARRARLAELDQQLVDVAHPRRECPRPRRPLRIVGEQAFVFLHRRAAARRH